MKNLIYKKIIRSAGFLGLVAATSLSGVAQVSPPLKAEKSLKEYRLKLVRVEDGKTTTIDTSFNLHDDAQLQEVVRSIQKRHPDFKMPDFQDPGLLQGIALRDSLHFRTVYTPLPGHQEDSELVRHMRHGVVVRDTVHIREIMENRDNLIKVYRPDSLREIDYIFLKEGLSKVVLVDSLLTPAVISNKIVATPARIKVFTPNQDGLIRESTQLPSRVQAPAGEWHRVVVISGTNKRVLEVAEARPSKKMPGVLKPSKKGDLKVKNLNLSPNPTPGRFNLKFNGHPGGDLLLEVMDTNGRVIYQEKNADFKGRFDKELDLSGNPQGVYLIRLIQGKNYLTKKVVLK